MTGRQDFMLQLGDLQVIEGAKKTWEERPEWKAVSDRVSMVGGDFFKSGEFSFDSLILVQAEAIPTGGKGVMSDLMFAETLPKLQDGDLVFMRAILHDCEAPMDHQQIVQTGCIRVAANAACEPRWDSPFYASWNHHWHLFHRER